MAKRAGSETVEVPASHAVYVSKPEDVARLIERAAKASAQRPSQGTVMAALGQKRKSVPKPIMSAPPPKADIKVTDRHVRYGP